jgi:hypothetical protein
VEPEHLANVVRWVGVVVALVASFLAAPAATRHLVGRIRTLIRRAAVATAAQARRLRDRLRGHATVRVIPANMGVAVGNVHVTGTGDVTWNVNENDDLPARVSRLEQRVLELHDMAKKAEQGIAKNAAESREAVARVEQRITDDVAAVYQRLADQEQEELRVDASALPVIGVGIVLSGVPDALATWTWLGALSIVVALAFLHRALVHFWTTAPDPI